MCWPCIPQWCQTQLVLTICWFLWIFLYKTMLSVNNSFNSLFPIVMPFISVLCLNAVARPMSTILNSSGKSGHHCVPNLGGKHSYSPLLWIIVTERLPKIIIRSQTPQNTPQDAVLPTRKTRSSLIHQNTGTSPLHQEAYTTHWTNLSRWGQTPKQRELWTCSPWKGDPKHSKLSKMRRQRNTADEGAR